ncbi:hypothetical protein HH310_42100 [Actinoplanes sp. TBRC 11911]|uniref:hypothetical protein n=1 Tax=Actinoplanes sp. TBRC 11911 TaxID=2729386 RepID=UPI00145D0E95|nr:hypothetical protein [Actinoplanes sp. TBRC 11911]NMO57744.1 hypothetical protein [Actinoplanes sp. TBRC 11911]
MVATTQMVGAIALGAMLLAIVVLGLVSWVKNSRRKRDDEEDSGSSTITDDATPGDWDSGSHGDL